VYQCTARDRISPDQNDTVEVEVASDPVMTSLHQTSATSVRVEWSQPSGGATVTGYVVHYSDGDTDRTESVAASSTSSDITDLTSGLNYTFSVEATSEHLSGESEQHNIILNVHPTVKKSQTTSPLGMSGVSMRKTTFSLSTASSTGLSKSECTVFGSATPSTVIPPTQPPKRDFPAPDLNNDSAILIGVISISVLMLVVAGVMIVTVCVCKLYRKGVRAKKLQDRSQTFPLSATCTNPLTIEQHSYIDTEHDTKVCTAGM
jgi:hypothetical protein